MPSADPVVAGPAAADPDPLGLEIADVVSRLRRAARAADREGSLPGGLSVAQLELLSCLADNPGARPGQLDRRTASLLLTPDGTATVVRWREINERILQSAITRLAPASRDALGAALPGLRELTGAVDALADEPQAGSSQNGRAGQR